jgi:transposase-like protein
MLIPLGLRDVHDELQDEVRRLVGERHSRQSPGIGRWGKNPGSVYLGDQKILIEVPRVRNTNDGCEIPLQSYQALQNPRLIDHAVMARLINGISSRKYERAALTIPETFGIRRNSVSRRFIRATARQLKKLMERNLGQEDIVAIFIDGKSLAELEVVIALGVTIEGKKLVLGFIETSTENTRVCKEFLSGLVQRGLKTTEEILFIIDGAKGIRKAIAEVFGAGTCVQRCQWHKRENVVSYLDKKRQNEFRGKLQAAYEKPTYDLAKEQLMSIRQELKKLNVSAVASLDEGLGRKR